MCYILHVLVSPSQKMFKIQIKRMATLAKAKYTSRSKMAGMTEKRSKTVLISIRVPQQSATLSATLNYIGKTLHYDNDNNFFFLSGFSFTIIHEPQDWRGRGGDFFNSSLPLPPTSQTFDIIQAIAAETSRAQIGNRWFPSASR